MKKLIILVFIILVPTLGMAADLNEIKAYFQIDQSAYRDDNAQIAAIGLVAPIDEKYPYAWALKLVENDRDGRLNDQLKAFPKRTNLSLIGKSDGLNCWLGKKPGQAGIKEGDKPCYSVEELNKYIEENKLFLERFKQQFITRQRFVNLPANYILSAQEMITGEKLLLANLVIIAKTDREKALQTWFTNMESLRKWNADQSGLVGRSITLVLYGLVEKQLPAILNNDSTMAAKYKEQLAKALAPFGPRQMDIQLAMKADFQLMASIFLHLGEQSMQKIYQLDQDYIHLAQTPPAEFTAENDEISARYNSLPEIPQAVLQTLMGKMQKADSVKPLDQAERNGLGNMLVKSIAVATTMIQTMNIVDANTRMHNAYAQIRAQNIAKDQIAAFLNNAGADMQDPFSGRAFSYDSKANILSSKCKELVKSPACSLSLD